jgi:protein-tyrosine phosphatase
VVSLLTPDEVVEFDLEKEAEACQNHGIEFMCFPIPDRGVPASRQEASAFLKRICQFLAAGQSVAVHCRQGIGRSGLIAGSLLILCGVTPEDAISRISQARGCVVPETAEQQEWLVGFRAASLRVVGEAVAQRMKD